MSPFSGGVIAAAAGVASPALWSSFVDGSMPMDVALTRFLIAVPVSWILLSLVAELAFPAPGSVRPVPAEKEGPAENEPPHAP